MAALALAAAAALGWLAGTPSGLRWAAAHVQSERLSLEGVSGTLAGEIRIARLRYRAANGLAVTAEHAVLRPQPDRLLVGTLAFEFVGADRLEVALPGKAAGPPPQRFALPLPFAISSARFAEVQVTRGDTRTALHDVRFRLRLGLLEHRLRDAQAETPWGRVSLEATMRARAPFRTTAHVELRRSEGRAKADAVLEPFAERPLVSVQASGTGIDLARVRAGLPQTAIDARLSARRGARAALEGTLSARNTVVGALDRGKLPLERLETSFDTDFSVVHLQDLRAAMAGRGEIAGSGELQRQQARLSLRVSGLDLAALRSSLARTSLSGQLELSLAPQEQSVDGELAQAGMRLSARAVRRGNELDVPRLRAEANGGTATGTARLQLDAPMKMQADLQLAGFDPSRFGRYPAGAVNGHVEVSGTLGAPRRVRASWKIAASRLLGQPLSSEGRAELEGDRVKRLDVQAKLGGNALSAHGALGGGNARLEWKLDAPRIEALLASVSGEVRARGVASGSWTEPLTTIEATASRLRLPGGTRLERVEAKARGTLGRQGFRGELTQLRSASPYALELQAPAPLAVAAGRVTLGRFDAKLVEGRMLVEGLEWTPGRLSTRGRFSALPAKWLIESAGLSASLDSTLRLEGEWSLQSTPELNGRLSVRRQSGDLTLEKPSKLALGLRRAVLEATFADGAPKASLQVDSALGTLKAEGRADGTRRDSGVDATVELDAADIRPFLGPLPIDVRLSGRAAAKVRVQGTIGAPLLSGSLEASQLGVAVPPWGVELRNGRLKAALQGDRVQVLEARIEGGEGFLELTGSVPVRGGTTEIDWRAERLRALYRPDLRLTVSGHGSLGFAEGRPKLAGEIRADSARIESVASPLPQPGPDVVVAGRAPPPQRVSAAKLAGRLPLALDVELALGDDFHVRAMQFDGRLTGNLHVFTEKDELRAKGRIVAADAKFRAYGQDLQVDPGEVIFDGPVERPTLNITAWRRNQQVEAGVRVTGTPDNPRIELVSQPQVAQNAQLSWLVLGRAPEQASTSDLALLQGAAAALLGRGDSVPVNQRIAHAVGLDELSLRGSSELASRVVAVGKRLSDRLYVTYERGLGPIAQNLVKIDYALSRRLSVRAQTGTASGLGLFYRYSWD